MKITDDPDAVTDSAQPIVCPFCPLHCDDVRINDPPDCSILRNKMGHWKSLPLVARIGREAVTIKKAQQDAVIRIANGKPVTLVTRGATLGQAKSMVRSGFEIAVQTSLSLAATANALIRCGTSTATLADVKQHADHVIILGDINQTIPRLLEKLGTASPIHCIAPPNAATVAELAASIRQGNVLAEQKYVAFLLGDLGVDANETSHAIELLHQTVLWMNRPGHDFIRRAVLVALDPLASLRCVHAWTYGNDLQIAEDSRGNATTIRVGTTIHGDFPAHIHVGDADPGPNLAEIFLPASTAGIHHVDAVIRGDGTVTLPLGTTARNSEPIEMGEPIETGLPSIAEWIETLSKARNTLPI
jgi:hypothetical protein